jgi:transglutaminase-like putative cysteine protease
VKYRITHTTAYSYGETVPLCHNVAHLKPRTTPRQRVLSHSMEITPAPPTLRERLDFFGNPVTWFSLQEPHQSLTLIARSEVDVTPMDPPALFQFPAWDQVAQRLRTSEPAMLDARQFTFDSHYIQRHPQLADYAASSFPQGRPLLDGVIDLTQRIFHEFTFDTTATTIGTPVLDVLHHRHGVCQDFAHLEIGCLRSLGLAARYVSGYMVTQPPPGKPRLIGADVSHAWLSVFLPDYGWIDVDPTNGLMPSAQHITLGWARDYDDLSPVKGVVVGGRRHSLGVSVDVEPVGEVNRAPAVAPASS